MCFVFNRKPEFLAPLEIRFNLPDMNASEIHAFSATDPDVHQVEGLTFSIGKSYMKTGNNLQTFLSHSRHRQQFFLLTVLRRWSWCSVFFFFFVFFKLFCAAGPHARDVVGVVVQYEHIVLQHYMYMCAMGSGYKFSQH